MRKFSRTNPQNRSMSFLTPMRLGTDTDNQDSIENFSIKMDTPYRGSDTKSYVIGETMSALALVSTLKRNFKRNLHYSFSKLKQHSSNFTLSKRKIHTIFTFAAKMNLSLKQQAFSKLRNNLRKTKYRLQGCQLTETCFKVISKRLKKQFFSIFRLLQKQSMTAQMALLREKANKYEENYIESEKMSELRKFQKINTKALKAYEKHAQQILKPTLQQILSDLQCRRKKKMVKSDSQIIIKISLSQHELLVQALKEINKLKDSSNQLYSSLQSTKISISKNSLEKNSIIKQLKKLDSELVSKNQGVFNHSSLKNAIKPFIKVLQIQKNQCSKKGEDNYIYGSRAILLQFLMGYVKKLIQAMAQPDHKLPNLKIKKQQSAISEKNSVQQSGIIQQVITDLSKILNTYGNCLGKSTKSVTKHLNSDSLRQMMNIREMIKDVQELVKAQSTQIQNLEKELTDKVQDIKVAKEMPVSKQEETRAVLERETLQILENKIQQLQNQIANIQKIKDKQLQETMLKFEKIKSGMDKQMENLTQKLVRRQKKLQKVTKTMRQLIETNQKLLQQVNKLKKKKQESEKIVSRANQQYKRFKTQFKNHQKEVKERQKSVKQLITPRSNKSRAISNFFASPKSQVGSSRSRAESFNSPKVLTKNKTLTALKSENMGVDENEQYKKRQKQIRELKQRIYQLKEEIAEKDLAIQVLQKKDGLIESENIVTLVYNILVKTTKIPEESAESQQIWMQLNQIVKQTADVDLLMGLEVFSVVWLSQNVVDHYQLRLRGLDNKQEMQK